MNKKNVTKHALLLSIVSMFLCSTMFIGTTFAWFTDSVTSANNEIQSGTLDVDLQMYDKGEGKYVSVANQEGAIFKANGNGINWEPGKTEVVYLKVQNDGNLTLKYDFLLTVTDNGLIGSLDYVIVDGDYSSAAKQFKSWEEVKNAWNEQQASLSASTDIPALYEGVIDANQGQLMPYDETSKVDEKCFALAIHMKEDAVNEFQGKTVTIDANVFATQASEEKDSFGTDYDATATYTYVKYQDGLDFAALWSATPAGSTIYLEKGNDDVITFDSLVVDKNMTLDAAGCVIEFANGVTFNEGTSLTIKNAKAETILVKGNGTLVLFGTTITANTDEVSALELDNAVLSLIVKGYTVLTGAKSGHGIHVGEGSTLDLSGTGKLVALGNAGTEDKSVKVGGSGIGGEGTINIHEMANLTAEGYGQHGFGIGGNGATVTIEETNIAYAKGGYVQRNMISDTKYGKSEPEGGAAIGGAVIKLDKVTIEKAEGGSKAAGIGAQFHQAVAIEINNSTIKEVIGGNASAGIGGSRIKETGQREQTVDITIVNSTVNAFGGEYGAGIGSGYDTHCSGTDLTGSPICTINIKGTSKISAEGGKYAAGIGTGYHAGGLAGGIENTVVIVKAVSGEKFYKTEYSQAQDIGFGVVDPAREGQTSVDCTFGNQGVEVKFYN